MNPLAKLKYSPAARRALAGPILARRWWRTRKQRLRDDALARFLEHAADDIVMRVDSFQGAFAMSPQSHLFRRLFINGEYEPELAKLFLKYLDPSHIGRASCRERVCQYV